MSCLTALCGNDFRVGFWRAVAKHRARLENCMQIGLRNAQARPEKLGDISAPRSGRENRTVIGRPPTARNQLKFLGGIEKTPAHVKPHNRMGNRGLRTGVVDGTEIRAAVRDGKCWRTKRWHVWYGDLSSSWRRSYLIGGRVLWQ